MLIWLWWCFWGWSHQCLSRQIASIPIWTLPCRLMLGWLPGRDHFSRNSCAQHTYSRFKAVTAVGECRCHKHACAVDPTLMHSSGRPESWSSFNSGSIMLHCKRNTWERINPWCTPLPTSKGWDTRLQFACPNAMEWWYQLSRPSYWCLHWRYMEYHILLCGRPSLSPWLVVHDGLHVGKDSISARCPLMIGGGAFPACCCHWFNMTSSIMYTLPRSKNQ